MTTPPPSASRASARNADRARAWEEAAAWAASADRCVWRLEMFKAGLDRAEEQPGSLVAPPARGRVGQRLRFFAGSLIGFLTLIAFLGRMRGITDLPAGASRLFALHGEIATRTTHLLRALPEAAPPVEAILLLGRLRQSPAQVAQQWQGAGYGPLPPLVRPGGFADLLRALPRFPRLWVNGIRASLMSPQRLDLASLAGIAFRVFHGAVMATWWRRQPHGPAAEVIFGITGTADTTMLEHAIQARGGRSIHMVHGQSNGPNFLGLSDLALFRSAHDARAHAAVGDYRVSGSQPAEMAPFRRGQTGLLLLSNLAHPMNPDFRHSGPRDELAVLRAVAGAADLLGARARPLRWRPHPVIAKIDPETAASLRAEARRLGFEELPPGPPPEEIAAGHRWLVSTPSTAALDLLQSGQLCVMLDPRGTLTDTAAARLPTSETDAKALAEVLDGLGDDAQCGELYMRLWQRTGPARSPQTSADLFTGNSRIAAGLKTGG